MRHRDRTPVIVVTAPKRRPADATRFANSIRAYAETHGVDGIVFVGSESTRDGEAMAVAVELVNGAAPHQGLAFSSEMQPSFALAERVVDLLTEAGMAADLGAQHDRDDHAWAAIRMAYAGVAMPVVRISVPANYGPDLMTLAGAALERLRDEGILLVGLAAPLHTSELKASARSEISPLLFLAGADRRRATEPIAYEGAPV